MLNWKYRGYFGISEEALSILALPPARNSRWREIKDGSLPFHSSNRISFAESVIALLNVAWRAYRQSAVVDE